MHTINLYPDYIADAIPISNSDTISGRIFEEISKIFDKAIQETISEAIPNSHPMPTSDSTKAISKVLGVVPTSDNDT
jgi:hypothetical protein